MWKKNQQACGSNLENSQKRAPSTSKHAYHPPFPAAMVPMVVEGRLDDLDGHIGIVGSGEWTGYYVLLEEYAEKAWILYWRNPAVADAKIQPGVSVGDELLTDEGATLELLRSEMNVTWIRDSEEAKRIEARYFSFPLE